MIKNGDYHVSLESGTNRLFLSKSEPYLILYKHADGTIRNKQGTRCLKPVSSTWEIHLTGKPFFPIDNQFLAYLI